MPCINKNNRNGHTNFLYVYFLFSYYIGFTPFRFKYDCHQQSTFTVHSWLPQKVLCAIIHAGILLRYALEIKKTHFSLASSDPVAYFRLIEVSSSFVCKLVAFHNFWRKKEIFFKIIRLLETSVFPKYNPYQIQTTVVLSLVCTFYILVSFIRLFLDPIFTGSSQSESWYERLLIESQYSYLTSSEHSRQQEGNLSGFSHFIAIITAANIQFRIIAGFYLDLGVLFSILSLWAPVLGYVTTLEESIEASTRDEFKCAKQAILEERNDVSVKIDENVVIRQFKLLKYLSELISEAIGGFLLPAITEIAFGYAIDFEDIILSTDAIRSLTNILFFLSTSSTFIFSAEICRKIACVKTWLSVKENDLKISRNELMMILDNIAHDGISITANGRLTINYSFVGAIVVVLGTFFIIRLQSESMPPPLPLSPTTA